VTFCSGDVLELRGDEALCVFGSARQAIRAAVELQKRFRSEFGFGEGAVACSAGSRTG